MSNSSFSGQTALITGASSGIGESFAKLLAEQKVDLILVARREDRLTELAHGLQQRFGINVEIIAKDLTTPGAAQDIFDQVNSRNASIR